MNLGLFFQVTAIFLFVFVVQLLISGFHEMSEQNYLPFSEPLHEATEPWGPDGPFGHMLTYLLVLLPMAWLIFAGCSAHAVRAWSRPRRAERRWPTRSLLSSQN